MPFLYLMRFIVIGWILQEIIIFRCSPNIVMSILMGVNTGIICFFMADYFYKKKLRKELRSSFEELAKAAENAESLNNKLFNNNKGKL
jgi:hypothetical protein